MQIQVGRSASSAEFVGTAMLLAAIVGSGIMGACEVLRMSIIDTVIFACVHNAGRSQIAGAFFNSLADPNLARAVSAGTRPGERVHPVVVETMKEVGIDVSGNRPQLLTEDLARDASLLITMGCGDECPHVPGVKRDDWPLSDPKDRPVDEVRTIRDEIRQRVESLINSHGWNRQAAR